MAITLDNSGACVSIVTRSGIDFLFDVSVDDASGHSVDLTGYTVEAKLNDGQALHDLDTTVVGDKISIHIPASMTAVLPASSRYSIVIESPASIRTSLVYGSVSCDRIYP